MSCRVLKRGMEKFVLNKLVNFAKENNYKFIIGEYIKTTKNDLVKNHYSELGFIEKNNKFYLKVENYKQISNYIN
jgi:predicted enzyme involved in methoxymalonyl-ACP biosynthesis